jgi:hypothetical protein
MRSPQPTQFNAPLDHQEDTWPFGKHVGNMLKDDRERKLLVPDFEREKNLAYKLFEYRTLVEPLDIANWYHRRKHMQDPGNPNKAHYIDGIDTKEDELQKDNQKRPGRYLRLQQLEHRLLGKEPASSLEKARYYRDILGTTHPLEDLHTLVSQTSPAAGSH